MDIKKEKERILKLIAGTTFVYDSEATENKFSFIEKATYKMDTQIDVSDESRIRAYTFIIKDFRTDTRHAFRVTDDLVNSIKSVVSFNRYIIQCLQRGMYGVERARKQGWK